MGLLNFLGGILGGGGAAVEKIAGVFTPNAEAQAERDARRDGRNAEFRTAAQAQFGAEFAAAAGPGRTVFDALVDGMNRLPRPVMALSAIGCFHWAAADPVGFSEAMTALELIPEKLWWIIGAITTFYFGARTFEKHRTAKAEAAHRERILAELAAFRERHRPEPAAPATAPAPAALQGVPPEALL